MASVISQAASDIQSMLVRGAAKIGRHAAHALGQFAATWDGDFATLDRAVAELSAARPSAVSLHNAVAFVARRARRSTEGKPQEALAEAADVFVARANGALAALGRHGAALVPDGGVVLTHCNSQGALAPLFEAHRAGKRFRVVATETRPWRQGLLTVRQLAEAGIDASLAVDSAMYTVLGDADLVLVGADTWASNGDVVNKIGTAGLGVLARDRDVPFYSCAETFKVDLAAADGAAVPIEERQGAEIVAPGEIPSDVSIFNPVFDVTPASFVRGYVCELGCLRAGELAPAARKAWEWD